MRWSQKNLLASIVTAACAFPAIPCLAQSNTAAQTVVPAAAVAPASSVKADMKVEKSSFGKTSAGAEVTLFTCTNANGLAMKLIDYGAIMTEFHAPDKNGKLANVNLSCQGMPGYEKCSMYFGATVGRYCNRIGNAKFELDGKTYQLAANNGSHHLHGGKVGFDKVMWKGEAIKTDDGVGVKFTRTSPDGEEGYPGTVKVTATYVLNNKNEMHIDFFAETDKATPVNLTNHNYWNLSGEGSGNILNHELQLSCSKYLAVDDTLIPTQEMLDVKGTTFDFLSFHKIGERIQQIKSDPVGYDHCYVIDGTKKAGDLAHAATVRDPNSGRVMEIWTTQPGIQFYSGNFLDGKEQSGGFAQYSAFCLETQHYPDSPNKPKFPSTTLKPGQTYHQKTVHKFSVAK